MAHELSIVVLVWTFLVGLACGSFLNVVVLRLPLKGVSIVRPRSHCTVCGATVRWYDNLPVLSYLILGGRCRACRTGFSGRYALVELLTGLAFAGSFLVAAWQGGVSGGFTADPMAWVRAVTGCALFFCLLVVTLVDLDRRVIPDEISLPGIVVGLVLAAALPGAFPAPSALTGTAALDGVLHAGLGAAVGGGVVFLLGWVFRALMGKEAMGLGDVKLLAFLGAFLFWDGALLTLVLASLGGSVGGTVYYVVRRDRYIPFGPFLALAGLAVYWAKPEIVRFVTETYPRWLSGAP